MTQTQTRRPVVLVVDDDQGIREALGVVLEADYEVMTAGDGRTALQAFRRQRVDAVLLDLRLPDIGGLEVLRQMHAIDPRVDVILVTAVHEIRTAVQAMRSGALDYITKPFETDDLLAVVAHAARRRCEGREILLISSEIGVLTALVVVLERTVGTAVCLSPRAALTCLAGRRPSLVVLENSTGPPTTTDLISDIRVRYPACPILTLTEPHGLGEMLEQVVVAMASFRTCGLPSRAFGMWSSPRLSR